MDACGKIARKAVPLSITSRNFRCQQEQGKQGSMGWFEGANDMSTR